jgi:hypothetical protein
MYLKFPLHLKPIDVIDRLTNISTAVKAGQAVTPEDMMEYCRGNL